MRDLLCLSVDKVYSRLCRAKGQSLKTQYGVPAWFLFDYVGRLRRGFTGVLEVVGE